LRLMIELNPHETWLNNIWPCSAHRRGGTAPFIGSSQHQKVLLA
jgi:hypothetical protein